MTGGSTTRILLIEDDYDVAEGVQRILETHGYDVDMAFDGAEGLAQTLGAQKTSRDELASLLDEVANRLRAASGG